MGEGNYLELGGRELTGGGGREEVHGGGGREEVTGGGGREEVTGEGKWERITSRFRGQAKRRKRIKSFKAIQYLNTTAKYIYRGEIQPTVGKS